MRAHRSLVDAMKVSPKGFVTFSSTIQDDSVECKGDIVVPGGRSVAEIIQRGLMSRGYRCDEVEQRSHYGWEFEVHDADAQFDVVLQWVEPWLVILEPSATFWRRLLRRSSEEGYRRCVDSLVDVLRDDGRFGDLQLFTREEYERGEQER